MDYPKFSKDKDRRCKVTHSQIERMRELRQIGFTLKEIGFEFHITIQAVSYWLKSDEERKEISKKRFARMTNEERSNANKASRESIKRKKKEMREQYLAYFLDRSKEFRKKNPSYMAHLMQERRRKIKSTSTSPIL